MYVVTFKRPLSSRYMVRGIEKSPQLENSYGLSCVTYKRFHQILLIISLKCNFLQLCCKKFMIIRCCCYTLQTIENIVVYIV